MRPDSWVRISGDTALRRTRKTSRPWRDIRSSRAWQRANLAPKRSFILQFSRSQGSDGFAASAGAAQMVRGNRYERIVDHIRVVLLACPPRPVILLNSP